MDKLDEFTRAYIEAALWSSLDESDPSGGRPLDRTYGVDDIDPEALKAIRYDCERFQRENAGTWGDDWSDEQAGHDFWLTRNRHGAGFWDRFYGGCPGARAGEKLTEASHRYGECYLYVGDDGKLYVQ
jgi:hypothetical protein